MRKSSPMVTEPSKGLNYTWLWINKGKTMRIDEIDQLDALTDNQLWNVAGNTENTPPIRQEAIQRWLFPDETNPEIDPNELSGGRLHELKRRATVLDSDEMEENDFEEVEAMAPYFDIQGRLILMHDGVSYLIDSLDDAGAYDGISTKDDLYTTDDKVNPDRDL
jgi:hypothetical protein